jgi:hypothetical protein
MTAPKFHALRDELYFLLHDEIRKAMSESSTLQRRYSEIRGAGA